MTTRIRGVVLPFRPIRRRPTKRGTTIPAREWQAVPQLDAAEEAMRNAAWDELLRLAILAWSWRDPDSLSSLGGALTAVRNEVEREWRT
jgi:hypothetical protein